ncbi:MAG: pro-sigmaK processing inhibitor BofA family protein [Oscillospiraceae bacterium]
MDIKEIILTAGVIILAVIMIVYYSKCKRKFTKILFGLFSGVAVLYPVQILIAALGGSLYVNIFTISVSAILGIPGVVLLGIVSFL